MWELMAVRVREARGQLIPGGLDLTGQLDNFLQEQTDPDGCLI